MKKKPIEEKLRIRIKFIPMFCAINNIRTQPFHPKRYLNRSLASIVSPSNQKEKVTTKESKSIIESTGVCA